MTAFNLYRIYFAEANTAAQDSEGPRTDWKGGGSGADRPDSVVAAQSAINNTHANSDAMHNPGKVKFEPPKVPVIFVLGGPGSGKVTHCDTIMQEKKGITHINMMDLLQQYAIGNGTNINGGHFKYVIKTKNLIYRHAGFFSIVIENGYGSSYA